MQRVREDPDDRSRASPWVFPFPNCALEREPQRELQNARLVARLQSGNAPKGAVAERGIRVRQVCMVQHVEGLSAKLQRCGLGKAEVLQQRCVSCSQARTAPECSGSVTEGVCGVLRKG